MSVKWPDIKKRIKEDMDWNTLRIQEEDRPDEIKYINGVIQGLRIALSYFPGKRGSVDK